MVNKMTIIKKKDREKLSAKILDSILDRIQEYGVRAEKEDLNDAYFLAWGIGMKADIQDALKKYKFAKRGN